MDWLHFAWTHLAAWPIWAQFRLEPSKWPTSGNVFGLAEYIAALALLLVIMVASDFKFRYRLAVTKRDLRKLSFWSALAIGLALLAIDFWYQNSLPVPAILSNANNLKAVIGLIFLVLVFRIIFVGVIRRSKFGKSNAKNFFAETYHFVHEGNSDKIQIMAEELSNTIGSVIKYASKLPTKEAENSKHVEPPAHQIYGHQLLLLLADERFCKIVVDKIPSFALRCIKEAQRYPGSNLPIFQFARNIGKEFIQNTSSSFYQEDSGYYSGLLGYDRPVSRIIFGSYRFVEKCASDGGSPLEADFRTFSGYNGQQMEGFSRASLAFLEDYLKVTKGRPDPHSYTLYRMMDAFERSCSQLHTLNGAPVEYANEAYKKLRVAVDFICEAIKLIEKHAVKPKYFKSKAEHRDDIFDHIAKLIFDIVFEASSVASPPWTTWTIQHNTIWSQIFGFDNNSTTNIIAIKLRRLIYDEIRRMDQFANFKGAKIIGYCLNVLGISENFNRKSAKADFYPLQIAAVTWVKVNYQRLLTDHPKVAEACIQGSITYEAKTHRLVRTYSNATRKEPTRDYLELLPRPRVDRKRKPTLATRKKA